MQITFKAITNVGRAVAIGVRELLCSNTAAEGGREAVGAGWYEPANGARLFSEFP